MGFEETLNVNRGFGFLVFLVEKTVMTLKKTYGYRLINEEGCSKYNDTSFFQHHLLIVHYSLVPIQTTHPWFLVDQITYENTRNTLTQTSKNGRNLFTKKKFVSVLCNKHI